MTDGALAGRVADLEDRVAIQGLLDSYAATLDRRDWEGFRASFSEQARTEYSWGSFTDVDALTEAMVDILAPFSVTEHIITNAQIALDGGRAQATAKLWVICVAPDDDPGEHLIEGGHYETEFVRNEGNWKISGLALKLSWAINGEPL